MKRFLVLAVVLMAGVLVGTGTAQAADKKYFSVFVGPSFRPDADASFSGPSVVGNPRGEQDVDVGGVGGVAVGLYLPNHLRVEGEVAVRSNGVDDPLPGFRDWSVGATSLMVNGYYDIPLHDAIQPYVGVGMGLGIASSSLETLNGFSDSDYDAVFAYQFTGGVQYRHDERFSFFTAYRYFATTDPDFRFGGVRASTEIDSHDWLFGVRIDFR